MTDVDVVVVGAGLAGLAAARRLTEAGAQVLVLEREEEPGGRARSEQWQGCTIELGPSFLSPAYRRLGRLVRECGLGDRLAPVPNAFRTAIRREGAWHHLDYRRPALDLVRYSGLSWREKASLARLLPWQLRTAAATRFFDMATVTAADVRRLEEVVDPAAGRYFASALAEVFLAYPSEEVSLAFAVLGSRYPTRRPLGLGGGLGTLTAALARRLPVRCGAAVEDVAVEEARVVVRTREGEAFGAGAVVVATRAGEALELWPQAPPPARRFLAGQTYSQGFGLFLRTSEPLDRRLYMEVVPRGEGTRALLAVVRLDHLAPDGGLLVLAAHPGAAAADADDARLAARLEADLAALHPEIARRITARRPQRWPVFVPSYPAGRARELASFRRTHGPGPVQLAGDYLYGPLMEAAVRAGQEAAARAGRHVASLRGRG